MSENNLYKFKSLEVQKSAGEIATDLINQGAVGKHYTGIVPGAEDSLKPQIDISPKNTNPSLSPDGPAKILPFIRKNSSS